jgi:hypothetical protein
MSDPHVSDRLIQQITRSTETLAVCEQTTRSAHALLAAAHLQMARSQGLHRQLDLLTHLSQPRPLRPEPRTARDER